MFTSIYAVARLGLLALVYAELDCLAQLRAKAVPLISDLQQEIGNLGPRYSGPALAKRYWELKVGIDTLEDEAALLNVCCSQLSRRCEISAMGCKEHPFAKQLCWDELSEGASRCCLPTEILRTSAPWMDAEVAEDLATYGNRTYQPRDLDAAARAGVERGQLCRVTVRDSEVVAVEGQNCTTDTYGPN